MLVGASGEFAQDVGHVGQKDSHKISEFHTAIENCHVYLIYHENQHVLMGKSTINGHVPWLSSFSRGYSCKITCGTVRAGLRESAGISSHGEASEVWVNLMTSDACSPWNGWFFNVGIHPLLWPQDAG